MGSFADRCTAKAAQLRDLADELAGMEALARSIVPQHGDVHPADAATVQAIADAARQLRDLATRYDALAAKASAPTY